LAQQKQLEKMQEFQRAAYEVEVFQNHLDVLSSIHKDCGEGWDWEEIRSSEPPSEPVRLDSHEKSARAALDDFRPGVRDKLLRRAESRREELAIAVHDAVRKDDEEHQAAMDTYRQECMDWQESRDLAERIITGDADAYLDAIEVVQPLGEISALGSVVVFECDQPSLIEVKVRVNGEDVIPNEVKSLLKSGKLSVKPLPKTRFCELYQDYVCGCALRIARELFALLPIDMAVVTAMGELLNAGTGHLEEQPILSVAIPRKTIQSFNFEMLDPSDSMTNFVHNMRFLKTKGFGAVEILNPAQFLKNS
jgi:hypothetical protein